MIVLAVSVQIHQGWGVVVDVIIGEQPALEAAVYEISQVQGGILDGGWLPLPRRRQPRSGYRGAV